MVWKPDDPQGNESDKVKFDVLPYCMDSGLDIGCGPHKVFPHFLGVDSMIDTRLFGIPMKPDIVADCTRLSLFADACVHTVFSSHTLEHIDDTRAALREWWRLVKPGGHLVLYLPHRDFYPNIGQPGANPDHRHDFVPDDIIDAMTCVAADWSLQVNEARDQGREYSFLQVYRKEPPGAGITRPCDAPKPGKTAGLVRLGGHGDALWASSAAAHLKDQGYHVTVYASTHGGEVIRHDPHIDRLIVMRNNTIDDDELLKYYAHEAVKYERWINLIGSVESQLLPHPSDVRFFLPHRLRHKLMNRNYLDMVHDYADVPAAPRQKYYPTAEEQTAARGLRDLLKSDGPLVVINPAGSGPAKYWPHSQRLMERLAEDGVYSVVLGDVRDPGVIGVEQYGHVVGMEWPIRVALAYALQADAVVATESVIANAVAFEPDIFKVITLSHSSVENLTRDWPNTASLEPQGLACYPCHRVHGADLAFCTRDKTTGASACQAMATADTVADIVIDQLRKNGKLPWPSPKPSTISSTPCTASP